jgi:hypothetical protein
MWCFFCWATHVKFVKFTCSTYTEHAATAGQSAADVAALRDSRRTVVEGSDLKPIRAFEHAGGFCVCFSAVDRGCRYRMRADVLPLQDCRECRTVPNLVATLEPASMFRRVWPAAAAGHGGIHRTVADPVGDLGACRLRC